MKTLSLMTSAWLALVAAPAAAADMPAPPPVVPAYTWSGCYAGIHAGGEWTSQSFRNSTTLADYGGNKASGGAAGGQLGCDYQMGVLVLGVQGMIDATNARSDNSLPASTNVITTKVDWLTTFTGRIGVTATPAALLYAKGGAAWIDDVHGIRNPAGTTLFNGQAIRSGWTGRRRVGMGLWSQPVRFRRVRLRGLRSTRRNPHATGRGSQLVDRRRAKREHVPRRRQRSFRPRRSRGKRLIAATQQAQAARLRAGSAPRLRQIEQEGCEPSARRGRILPRRRRSHDGVEDGRQLSSRRRPAATPGFEASLDGLRAKSRS